MSCLSFFSATWLRCDEYLILSLAFIHVNFNVFCDKPHYHCHNQPLSDSMYKVEIILSFEKGTVICVQYSDNVFDRP